MKYSPLKHYKRKKFYFRLFLRKSPRTAAMFGLAWMNMVIGLLPFLLYAIIRSCGFPSDWTLAGIALGVLLTIPLYLYGFLVCEFGIDRLYRGMIKSEAVSSAAGGIGAWFLPLLGLVLIPVLIWKKRYLAVLFAFSGTVLYGLSYFQYFNLFSVVLLGSVFYLAALAFTEEKQKFSWKFMFPFGIAAAAYLSLFCYNIFLQHDVKVHLEQLSQTIGRSVEMKAFLERESQGFPLDREPLKTMIANPPDTAIEEYEFKNAEQAQKKLQEYQKKYSGFVNAMNHFLQLPASRTAHQIPENDSLYGVHLPELNIFRESARYLAMKIAASPTEKQVVTRCNQDLIKLREWMLQSHFLLSHLVAIAVENIRLKALATVLTKENFSRQELIALIGAPVDWEKSLRHAYGDEATSFKSGLDFIQGSLKPFINRSALDAIKRHLPLYLNIHFQRDHRFALQTYIKACSLPSDLSGLKKSELAKVDEKELKRNAYILSGMLLPALDSVFLKDAQIMDTRQMALLAADVMEYRRQHGTLPADLSFLQKIPLAKFDHTPFMYEKTIDGFRIFSRNKEGKIPVESEIWHTYQVILPQKK